MPFVQNWENRDQAAIAAGLYVYCGQISFSISKAKFAEFLSARGHGHCLIYWPPQKNAYAHMGWCQLQFEDRAAATAAQASLDGVNVGGRPMKTGPVQSQTVSLMDDNKFRM